MLHRCGAPTDRAVGRDLHGAQVRRGPPLGGHSHFVGSSVARSCCLSSLPSFRPIFDRTLRKSPVPISNPQLRYFISRIRGCHLARTLFARCLYHFACPYRSLLRVDRCYTASKQVVPRKQKTTTRKQNNPSPLPLLASGGIGKQDNQAKPTRRA